MLLTQMQDVYPFLEAEKLVELTLFIHLIFINDHRLTLSLHLFRVCCLKYCMCILYLGYVLLSKCVVNSWKFFTLQLDYFYGVLHDSIATFGSDGTVNLSLVMICFI